MQEEYILPGTTIRLDEGKDAKEVLDGLFIGGGLVLSQVSELTGLEGYMIQNWVKRGYMTPTVSKRYTKEQFCRLITINLLRDCLTLSEIAELISLVNGQLDDESDDLIDDSLLYIYLTRILRTCRSTDRGEVLASANAAVADCEEPVAGFKEMLTRVLCVMYLAYNSSLLARRARTLLQTPPRDPAGDLKT